MAPSVPAAAPPLRAFVRTLLRACAGAFLAALALLATAPLSAPAQPEPGAGRPTVLLARLDGTVTPVVAEHLEDGVRRAQQDGHAAFLVEMDTPGGLLTSTRDIVQSFLGAPVPVIVYVTPSGARAASAGAYITLSANIAAMAPGTHIGAGTPVTGRGEPASDKVVNDSVAFARSLAEQRGRSERFATDMVREGVSVPDREALRLGAVDLVVPSRAALLDAVDGQQVRVGPPEARHDVVLHTAGAEVVAHELGFFGGLRQLLASPELAYLFLSIGTLAVIYELAAPGVGLAGVTGVILLVLGFVALSVLPFNAAGLLLLGLAALLFVAEVLTPGVGVFAVGGTAALVFGGVFLFRGEVALDPLVIWPTAVVIGLGVLFAGRLAWRARAATPTIGREAFAGRTARVRETDPDGRAGQVLLDGAWWTVRPRSGRVHEGQTVRVVDRDGLHLVVDPVDTSAGQSGASGESGESGESDESGGSGEPDGPGRSGGPRDPGDEPAGAEEEDPP